MKVTVTRMAFPYRNRLHRVGETLDLPEPFARHFAKYGRVALQAQTPEPKPEREKETPKKKKGYGRRDMRAED